MALNAMTCPRERRSGGIETKPGAAPGIDLHGGEPDARGAAPLTPSYPASRPGPRSGRVRRLALLLPVLALLLGPLSLFAVGPASADVLVSNIGQDKQGDFLLAGSGRSSYAQGFTTPAVAGYVLRSIELQMALRYSLTAQDWALTRVELWSDNGGAPGSKIASLKVPRWTPPATAGFPPVIEGAIGPLAPPLAGLTCTFEKSSGCSYMVKFTAPANTVLSASTTYHVVAYNTSTSITPGKTSNIDIKWEHPAQNSGLDATSVSGWTLVNRYRFSSSSAKPPTAGTSWLPSGSFRFKIRVNGSQPPPAAPTNLSATPSTEQLRIRWTKPPGPVTGYDMHYTLAPAGPCCVPDTAGLLNHPIRNNPAVGWVTVAEYGGTGTDFRWYIPGRVGTVAYKNYRLRVRARNSAGAGEWAFVTGTPTGTVFTPSADALVSNFRRTFGSDVELFYNTAQGFTTGNAAFGYSLRSIDVRFRAGNTNDPNFIPQVELWSATAGGAPDAKIADLRVNSPTPLPRNARPVSLTTRAKTTLDSNTTYFVVFRIFASGTRKIGLAGTTSDSEEPGAAPGWSIANSLHQYIGNWQAGNWQLDGGGASLHIRVNGSPAPATVSLSASPTTVREGSTVTVTATLSAPLSEDVSIPLNTAMVPFNSATVGSYDIAIPAGRTTGTHEFTAPQVEDGEIEQFQIAIDWWRMREPRPLESKSSQSIAGVTVLDENADPHTVSVSDANGSEQFRYGRLCFEFTLNRAASHEVWVNYWTEDGTAKAGHDYT